MTTLYLVRHGETDWNFQRRIQGSTDIPLNATGREQAAATGRLLARRPWSGIVSSPLSRATETAKIIANAVGFASVLTLPAIVERHYGDAEGLNFEEVEARFPGNTPVPGRETREQVTARVIPALVTLAERHPGEAIIVVTHGGVIRSVLNEVDPLITHGPITNGSVHSFEHADGSLQLIAFNDPLELLSVRAGAPSIEQQNVIENRDSRRS